MAEPNPYASLVPASGNNPYAGLVPTTGGGLAEAAYQAVGPGFNKGLSSLLKVPGDVAAWAVKKLGVPEEAADKLRFNNGLTTFLDGGSEPTTTAGRYGEAIGKMAGGSVLPQVAVFKAAPMLAAIPQTAATTTMGRIGGQMGQAITAAPGAAVGLDAAGTVASAVSSQAAKEAGFSEPVQALAGIAGGFVPGVASATLPARQIAQQRATDTAADLAAHEALSVRPFGPAFGQPGGAVSGAAKQLSETMLIGAPVRNALDESLTNARDASLRIAQRMGPETAHNEMGLMLQNGLERYRNSGIRDIPEQALTAIGVQPSAMVPSNRMMTQAAAQRAQEADLNRVAAGVPPRPINQLTVQRRGAGDLSDTELAAVARRPSAETSFAAKAEAAYERAWRALPDLVRSNGTQGNDRVQAVNTRSALGDVQGQVANQISGQGRISGDLAGRLANGRSHFSIEELRGIRTEVGRALGNYGQFDARLDRTQLRQLYGSLSRDIEVGVMDMANRARNFSVLPPSDPRYVSPAVVDQAERALGMMRRADQLYAAGMDRVDRFQRVIGANTPEAAAKMLQAAALGSGRGNIEMLRTARASLAPEEFQQFSGQVLRNMGQPIGSARGTTQEIGFSVSSFLTRWNNMEPRARSLLFGGEHTDAVDNLVRVVNRLANVEAMANTSRSATNAINVAGAASVVGSAASGHWALALGQLGAGYSASLIMSRPELARWATRYAALRARALQSPGVADQNLAEQIARLGTMSRADPALRPLYEQAQDDYPRP